MGRVTGEIKIAASKSRLRIAMLLKMNPVMLLKKLARLREPSSNPCTRRVFPPCLVNLEWCGGERERDTGVINGEAEEWQTTKEGVEFRWKHLTLELAND